MTKLLPFAAQGSAPFGLRDATTSRPPGGLQLDTTLCSSSGLDSAVSFWAGGDRQFILRRRLSLLSVICSSKRTSGSSAGGKQAVLEKRNRTVSPSKRKSGGSSDVANLWPAGETVTALEPREEGYVPLVGLFKGNSGRGKTSAAEKSLETPENARNADALSEECTSVLKFEEPASEQSAKVEGVNEEEWVEIDDEEWDRSLKDQEEDVELVEVWEGDLPPMTAEEEAVLLLEAEQELAELERERLDKERRTSHGTASSTTETQIPERTEDSHVSEMEKELARLKDLVSTMEKQLAVEKGRSVGKKKPALSPIPQGLASSPDDSDDVNLGAREHSEEVQRGDTVAPTSKFLEVYKWDEKEGIVKRSDKHQTESQNEVRHGTPLRPLYDASLSEVTLPSSGNGENGHSMLREATTGLQNLHLEKRAGRQRRVEGEEEDEDFELEENEKRSIPAVMRCFDRAKIYVKAGDGGDGVVAFRREKFVPFGGPSGGNGGDGGDVYIEADPGINSLLPFRRSVHFRATRGSHGQGKGKSGATGDHCTVKVPVGTAVKQAEGDGNVLLELIRPGQRGLLLPGGRGGRGNAAFKTGRNKTPQIAENGEEGAEMWLQLELKLVADVGIIGVPNAGKSTLLSAISAARPEIANYPFTTLLPNLGVVDLGFDASMVVADLPGLLEGAHTGYGLGHEFLRHTERCRVLIHVVDGMSPQAQYEYDAVRLELQLFNPELEHKPFLVAYNKMDVPEAAERWESFQDFMRSKGVEPFCMSAATRSGTEEITKAAYNLAKQNAQTESQDEGSDGAGEQNLRSVGDMVKRQRSAPIEEFTVSCDKHTRTWEIDGAGLKRFTQMTNWEYFEAVRRFQHVLNASGVSKSLREQGVKEGDTVIVGELEFNWIDSDDMRSLGEWKRGIRGSKVWPH